MVLRILVLLLLSFTTFSFAGVKPKRKTIFYKTAAKLYLKKQYKKSLRTLDKFYNINKPSKLNSNVTLLLAMNLFKLKRYKSSSRYFHYVIQKKYRNLHSRVLGALEQDNLEDIKIPPKLLRIYYRLGQIYYYYFSKTDKVAYYRASEKYFKICEFKDHLGDNAYDYRESLAEKKAYIDKKEFNWTWFTNVGTLNWQEKIILEDSRNGNQTKLLSNARALCLGGGFRYMNSYHGFEVQGCGFSGSAKVSANNPKTYSQTGVNINGFLLDSGYTFVSSYEKASITFSLPLFYRNGSYEQPSNYQILGKAQLSAGGMIKGRWQLPYVDFVMSMANMGWTNLFMMQAAYTF